LPDVHLRPLRQVRGAAGTEESGGSVAQRRSRRFPAKTTGASEIAPGTPTGQLWEAIRTGGFAMTRKREKPILTAPLSSSQYEAAVAEFIRNRGVTRCPTACLVRTQASVPEADRTALEHYEAGREQSRRSHIAATARLLGVPIPPPSV
jgi:hypothetical protein